MCSLVRSSTGTSTDRRRIVWRPIRVPAATSTTGSARSAPSFRIRSQGKSSTRPSTGLASTVLLRIRVPVVRPIGGLRRWPIRSRSTVAESPPSTELPLSSTGSYTSSRAVSATSASVLTVGRSVSLSTTITIVLLGIQKRTLVNCAFEDCFARCVIERSSGICATIQRRSGGVRSTWKTHRRGGFVRRTRLDSVNPARRAGRIWLSTARLSRLARSRRNGFDSRAVPVFRSIGSGYCDSR